MSTWPQIVMVVLMTLTFVGSVRRDKQEFGHLGVCIVLHMVARTLFTVLLYYGGFWKSLGWAP